MAVINFSGIASGIDTSSLIKALLDQQRSARVVPLQNQRSKLEESNSAFGELKSLLSKLSDASQTFRTLNGGAVAKQGISSAETVVGISATNAAQSGTYNLTVSQLAKNGTYSYDDRFASSSSVVNSAINNGAAAVDRTVSIEVGSGASAETVNVELTNATTMQDFISAFNSQSTLATASAVNVGTTNSPSYAIVINSNSQGTSLGTITQTALGSELAAGSGAFQTATTSQATNAMLTLSGVSGTITRESNSISDVVSGATLSLQSLGNAQVSIAPDATATSASLQTLVDTYNAVINYVTENDRVTQEQDSNGQTTNIFAAFAASSLDENILSSLRGSLSGASVSGGLVNTLADLGITTQRDGSLAFDSSKFQEALGKDPTNAAAVLTNLADDLGGVTGKIAQFTRYNGSIDTVVNTNSSSINSLNKRIIDIESSLKNQEGTLTKQYARLEGLIGKLNSQQSTLSSMLPS